MAGGIKLEAYQSFAEVYDLFMDNVPYDEWADLYHKILSDQGVTNGILLDLGCGTGQMTRRFAAKGYDMIGVDASPDMLDIARQQEFIYDGRDGEDAGALSKGQKEILYLLQDMREFELYGTVAAVISVCDSLNYILKEDDMLQVFRLVNNYLDPGGLFVFDMNTVWKYENLLGQESFCENRDEAAFLWENDYNPDDGINTYDLAIFVQESDGRFARFEETHYQRAWNAEKIDALLEQAGLKMLGVYGMDDDSGAGGLRPLHADDERMYIVAREQMKRPGV